MSQNSNIDFQELVKHCKTLAEKLLIEQEGEFFPFGAKISQEGNLTHCGLFEGDDFPLSETIIKNLKHVLMQELTEGVIRSFAISFDSKVKKDENSEKVDAIAIECLSKEALENTTYYVPYKFTESKKLIFKESWETLNSKHRLH